MTDQPKRKPGRPVGTHPPRKYTERLNVYFTPGQLARLRAMAREAGQRVSVYIRGALGLEDTK